MDARKAFVVLVLLSQALIPVHWYLAPSYDERFAWRMFSPTRMVRCQADFVVDGEPIPLEQRFHSAWLTLVKRGRPDVVAAVGSRLCLVEPGADIRLTMRCREASGTRVLAEDEAICP